MGSSSPATPVAGVAGAMTPHRGGSNIEEQFGHLPTDVTRKIVCENAGRYYGLMT